MCRGAGYNEHKDYFYITEGQIILQTWCQGLKHVPSQGGWQVMLFILGRPHSQTMFGSLRKEFVGCFWPGKISLYTHHVPWPMSRFESSPRVGEKKSTDLEKGFWIMSLLLVKSSRLGKLVNLWELFVSFFVQWG